MNDNYDLDTPDIEGKEFLDEQILFENNVIQGDDDILLMHHLLYEVFGKSRNNGGE